MACSYNDPINNDWRSNNEHDSMWETAYKLTMRFFSSRPVLNPVNGRVGSTPYPQTKAWKAGIYKFSSFGDIESSSKSCCLQAFPAIPTFSQPYQRTRGVHTISSQKHEKLVFTSFSSFSSFGVIESSSKSWCFPAFPAFPPFLWAYGVDSPRARW